MRTSIVVTVGLAIIVVGGLDGAAARDLPEPVLTDQKLFAAESPFVKPKSPGAMGVHGFTEDGEAIRDFLIRGSSGVKIVPGRLLGLPPGQSERNYIVFTVRTPVRGRYELVLKSYNAKGHREFDVYVDGKRLGTVGTPTVRDFVVTEDAFVFQVTEPGEAQVRLVNRPAPCWEASYLAEYRVYCLATEEEENLTPYQPASSQEEGIEIPRPTPATEAAKAERLAKLHSDVYVVAMNLPMPHRGPWISADLWPKVVKETRSICDIVALELWEQDSWEDATKALEYIKSQGMYAILDIRTQGMPGVWHTPGFCKRLIEAYPEQLLGLWWHESHLGEAAVQQSMPDSRLGAVQIHLEAVRNNLSYYAGCGAPLMIMKGAAGLGIPYDFMGGFDVVLPEQLNCIGPWVVWISNLRGGARQFGKLYGDLVATFSNFRGWDCIETRKPSELELSFLCSYYSGQIPTTFWYEDASPSLVWLRPYGVVMRRFRRFIHNNPIRGRAVTPVAIVRGVGDGWYAGLGDWRQQETLNVPFNLADVFSFGSPEQDRGYCGVFAPGLGRMGGGAFGNGTPAGFWLGTPYGQFDFILSNASAEFLSRYYNTLIYLGWNSMSAEQYNNLLSFVRAGGRVLLSAGQLQVEKEGIFRDGQVRDLFGVRLAPQPRSVRPASLSVIADGGIGLHPKTYSVGKSFALWPATIEGAQVIAQLDDGSPLLVVNQVGKGKAFLLTAEYLSVLDGPIYDNVEQLFGTTLLRRLAETAPRPVEVLPPPRHVHYSVLENDQGYVLFAVHVGGDFIWLKDMSCTSPDHNLNPISLTATYKDLDIPFTLQPANLYLGVHEPPMREYEEQLPWLKQVPEEKWAQVSEQQRMRQYQRAYNFVDPNTGQLLDYKLHQDSLFRAFILKSRIALAPVPFYTNVQGLQLKGNTIQIDTFYPEAHLLRVFAAADKLPLSVKVDGMPRATLHASGEEISLPPGSHTVRIGG